MSSACSVLVSSVGLNGLDMGGWVDTPLPSLWRSLYSLVWLFFGGDLFKVRAKTGLGMAALALCFLGAVVAMRMMVNDDVIGGLLLLLGATSLGFAGVDLTVQRSDVEMESTWLS